MAKPWMETWDPKADCTTNGQRIWTIYDRAREDADGTYEVATVEHDDEPAARLVAAAPAMARALCLLERGTVMLPSESGGASSPIGGSSLPDGGELSPAHRQLVAEPMTGAHLFQSTTGLRVAVVAVRKHQRTTA